LLNICDISVIGQYHDPYSGCERGCGPDVGG
jgi:hypothetical protein